MQEVPVVCVSAPVKRKQERDVPDVGHNDGALGDEVPIVHVVLLDAVGRAEWGSWAPADDLLEHRGKVWKRVAVCERGKPVVANDGVELGLTFLLDFRVHGHGEQEGGHRGDGLCKWVSERTI